MHTPRRAAVALTLSALAAVALTGCLPSLDGQPTYGAEVPTIGEVNGEGFTPPRSTLARDEWAAVPIALAGSGIPTPIAVGIKDIRQGAVADFEGLDSTRVSTDEVTEDLATALDERGLVPWYVTVSIQLLEPLPEGTEIFTLGVGAGLYGTDTAGHEAVEVVVPGYFEPCWNVNIFKPSLNDGERGDTCLIVAVAEGEELADLKWSGNSSTDTLTTIYDVPRGYSSDGTIVGGTGPITWTLG